MEAIYTSYYVGMTAASLFATVGVCCWVASALLCYFDKNDMGEPGCGLIMGGVLCFVITFAIGGTTIKGTRDCSQAAYQNVVEWGKNHPQMATHANTLMASDGIIDGYEYHWLGEEAKRLDHKKNALLRIKLKAQHKKQIKLDVK